MLTVSISVSALMTQIKMQEHVRLKAEKERMRANLLRAVSHDIRTPLTSIEGADVYKRQTIQGGKVDDERAI